MHAHTHRRARTHADTDTHPHACTYARMHAGALAESVRKTGVGEGERRGSSDALMFKKPCSSMSGP
jgi:hypothetical protein